MGWKENVKEWGSIAWHFVGIIMGITLVLGVIGASMFSSAQSAAKKHFKEKHGVVCDCK